VITPITPKATKAILAALERLGETNIDLFILETIIRTGVRSAELAVMRAEDVDMESSMVLIHAVKGSRDHRVPLTKEYSHRLYKHLRAFGTMVGHRTRSTNVNTATAIMRQIFMRNARLFPPNTSLHDLRGAFAILVYDSTKDILLVQELLGHKSLSSTQVYVRMSNAFAQRDAVLKSFR
jgi:integrase/recombinase XerD